MSFAPRGVTLEITQEVVLGISRLIVVVMAVMMVPGLGRSFGSGAAEEKSCGDHRDRRPRSAYSSWRRLFVFQHILLSLNSIATYVTNGTPVPFDVRTVAIVIRPKIDR